MHLPTFYLSLCYGISELVTVSGSLCSNCPLLMCLIPFLSHFNFSTLWERFHIPLSYPFRWYFSGRRTLAHKISHWQMRSSKSLTALSVLSCTSQVLLPDFWLNDQYYTQYSGYNWTVDGIMVFPVLASVPFLTLLALCFLFDYPWA